MRRNAVTPLCQLLVRVVLHVFMHLQVLLEQAQHKREGVEHCFV